MEPLDELMDAINRALPNSPTDDEAATGSLGSTPGLGKPPAAADGGRRDHHAKYWAVAKACRAGSVAALGTRAAKSIMALAGGALAAGADKVTVYAPSDVIEELTPKIGDRGEVLPLTEAKGVDVIALDGCPAADIEARGRHLFGLLAPSGVLLVDGINERTIGREAQKLRCRNRAVLTTANGTLLLMN